MCKFTSSYTYRVHISLYRSLNDCLKLLQVVVDKPKIVLNVLRRHETGKLTSCARSASSKKCNLRVDYGCHSINFTDEVEEVKDVLHNIVRSEAYSDEEFTECVKKLGKNWYTFNSQYNM